MKICSPLFLICMLLSGFLSSCGSNESKKDTSWSTPNDIINICNLIATLRYHRPNESVTPVFNNLVTYGKDATNILILRLEQVQKKLVPTGSEFAMLVQRGVLGCLMNENQALISLLYACFPEYEKIASPVPKTHEYYILYNCLLAHYDEAPYMDTFSPPCGFDATRWRCRSKNMFLRSPLMPTDKQISILLKKADADAGNWQLWREIFSILKSGKYELKVPCLAPKSIAGKFILESLRIIRDTKKGLGALLAILRDPDTRSEIVMRPYASFVLPSLPSTIKWECFSVLKDDIFRTEEKFQVASIPERSALECAIWLNDVRVDTELLKIIADKLVPITLKSTIVESSKTLRERVIAYSDIAGLLRWVVGAMVMLADEDEETARLGRRLLSSILGISVPDEENLLETVLESVEDIIASSIEAKRAMYASELMQLASKLVKTDK